LSVRPPSRLLPRPFHLSCTILPIVPQTDSPFLFLCTCGTVSDPSTFTFPFPRFFHFFRIFSHLFFAFPSHQSRLFSSPFLPFLPNDLSLAPFIIEPALSSNFFRRVLPCHISLPYPLPSYFPLAGFPRFLDLPFILTCAWPSSANPAAIPCPV